MRQIKKIIEYNTDYDILEEKYDYLDSLDITDDNHNGNNNDDDKKLPHCKEQSVNCRKVSAPVNNIHDDDEDNEIDKDIHKKDDNGSYNDNNDHNDG